MVSSRKSIAAIHFFVHFDSNSTKKSAMNFLSHPLVRSVPVSLLATAADMSTGYALTENGWSGYASATFWGNTLGMVVGFFLSKYWAFRSVGSAKNELVKYGLVSGGNSLLNVVGVFAITSFISIDYLIVRVIVGSVVFVFYSYLLNEKFVFKKSTHENAPL
jgi:putative flippase GtrA